MRSRRPLALAVLLAAIIGCEDGGDSTGGNNPDGGGQPDGGVSPDAGANPDAGDPLTEFFHVSSTPSNGDTEVALNTNVVIEMNADVDPTTLVDNGDDTGTFQIRDRNDVAVAGRLSANGTTITFEPDSELASDMGYVVTLRRGLASTSGLETTSVWTFRFSTVSGPRVGPTLVRSTPAADAMGVGIESEITLEFSGDVDGDSITAETLRLTAVGFHGSVENAEIPYSATVAADTITIRPDELQEYETSYRVSVTDAALGANGEPLQMEAWRFTTARFDPGFRYEIHSNNTGAIGFSEGQDAFAIGDNPVGLQIARNSQGFFYLSHTAGSMALPSNEEFMSSVTDDAPVDYGGTDDNGFPFGGQLWEFDRVGANRPEGLGWGLGRYRIRNRRAGEAKALTGQRDGNSGFTFLYLRDDDGAAAFQQWIFKRGEAL